MSDLNDPRVLFAAERTLLAWNRTALTLMGFGFVIERFGLFVRMVARGEVEAVRHGPSFWGGLAFIIIGAACAIAGIVQHRRVLASLRPVEIPPGYHLHLGLWITALVALLGIALTVYLFASPGL